MWGSECRAGSDLDGCGSIAAATAGYSIYLHVHILLLPLPPIAGFESASFAASNIVAFKAGLSALVRELASCITITRTVNVSTTATGRRRLLSQGQRQVHAGGKAVNFGVMKVERCCIWRSALPAGLCCRTRSCWCWLRS